MAAIPSCSQCPAASAGVDYTYSQTHVFGKHRREVICTEGVEMIRFAPLSRIPGALAFLNEGFIKEISFPNVKWMLKSHICQLASAYCINVMYIKSQMSYRMFCRSNRPPFRDARHSLTLCHNPLIWMAFLGWKFSLARRARP
jgi:hypothetical protein